MSAEDASEPKLEPPAVRAGMVRQLLQTRFSEKIVTARGKPKALVIGDPGAEPMQGFPGFPAQKPRRGPSPTSWARRSKAMT